MDTKRSHLDNLNTGRKRRSGTSLEHISRTLQEIEDQLDRAYETAGKQASNHDPEGHRERGRAETPAPRAPEAAKSAHENPAQPAEPGRHSSLRDLASDLERTRSQESEFRSIGNIASEVKLLREELGQLMTSGLRQEFDTLRDDIREIQASTRSAPATEELGAELERLSSAIGSLPGRGDQKTLQMLRLELEQVKSVVGGLAREETVKALGKSVEEFTSQSITADGRSAMDAMAARLEEISNAVAGLPESLPLQSLDEKVRTLAGALDQFIEHSSQLRPELHHLIDERLDEISRAIAATAAAAKSPTIDSEPFERIEARIASLSRQVEEIVEDTSSAQIAESLTFLTNRVDHIAQRVDQPREAVADLTRQIALISDKLEQTADAHDTKAGFQQVDERMDGLSEFISRRQHEDMEESRTFFHDLQSQLQQVAGKMDQYEASTGGGEADMLAALDERFSELASRIEVQAKGSSNDDAFGAIEARLEELSTRLQDSSSQIGGLDPEVIRNLEMQIGTLADHLAQPAAPLPDFEDLGPRLARIERLIAENREAVVDAARDVAEQTLGSVAAPQTGEENAAELISELKALEMLTRRSDDRNARTFEAIHDTLLKIVDRLGGSDEITQAEEKAPAAERTVSVESAPSIDPDHDETLFDLDKPEDAPEEDRQTAEADAEKSLAGHSNGDNRKRTPAEAAAAAAIAALQNEDGGEDEEAAATPSEKKSLLGGVTRAFSGRKQRASANAVRKEPAIEASGETGAGHTGAAAHDDAGASLDEDHINAPLEPGSGTPDLNAIMRRVRDEGGQRAQQNESDAAKSDFIAAARRAAQAAAAEAETLKKKGADPHGSTGGFSIGQVLRSRKKTALMGLAGLAVVAGGVTIGHAYLSDADAPAKTAGTNLVAKKQPGDDTMQTAAVETAAATPARPAMAAGGKAEPRMIDDEPPMQADAGSSMQASAEPAPMGPKPQSGTGMAAPDAQTSNADAMNEAPADPERTDQIPAVDDSGPAMEDTPAAMADTNAGSAKTGTPDTMQSASIDPSMSAAEPQATPAAIRLEDIPEAAGPIALRQAAASGDAKAMYEIGNHYAQGQGVKENEAAAADWYEKAAEAGLPPAQYRIGNAYEKAIGVKRDLDKAKNWYELAARQGNASAMHNLGVLDAMGASGKPDNKAAVGWFMKAAELGVKDSQFNLGILAAKGVGMTKDLEESYKWFALVAETGDKDAAAKRDEIAKALDKDQLKSARAKSELWKPRKLDREANMVVIPDDWTDDTTTTASVDKKKAVKTVQLILNKNGYEPGPADGIMGEQTKSAIAAFQKDNELKTTGDINPELVQALLDRK